MSVQQTRLLSLGLPMLNNCKNSDIYINNRTVKFIDLFAGMGGMRIGFQEACKQKGRKSKCVFTSEIKEYAIDVYKRNFLDEDIAGDITKISPLDIPDHDYLLAGFPCQPFSVAGNRKGFLDEKGGLFFTICSILKSKQPSGFLLENVEGLVTHDGGKTLNTIIYMLELLGYNVSWKVLNSFDFGVAQQRKRIYITGHQDIKPDLSNFSKNKVFAGAYIEDIDFVPTLFSKLLCTHFTHEQLYGKSIKDKRGGGTNIHSWEINLKGEVSEDQRKLLSLILKKRRYKKWAELKGIKWMDGMPLTIDEIKTFYTHAMLQDLLDDLVSKGYLVFEHPKKQILIEGIKKRVPHVDAPKGYNIVAGKLSFPIAKILDPNSFVPTIVATEIGKIAVSTLKGVRPITIREGLRFSGYPENYNLELSYNKAFDLIGNTVVPPVIREVVLRILD